MKYALTLGQYNGDAGDSLGQLSFQRKIATATKHLGTVPYPIKGAWWYGSCYHSNLNGVYINDGSRTDDKGLRWNLWKFNVMKF